MLRNSLVKTTKISSLDHEVVKEGLKKMVGPTQRRQLAQWIVKAKAYSQQRACRSTVLSRLTFAYQSERQSDTAIEQAVQSIAYRYAFIERFNGSFRRERLNAYLFRNLLRSERYLKIG